MATIVQPYNDWRERAIVNFVGPIIGDWIQRSREAENNRKQNALTAKVLQDINGNNSENLINPLHSQNNGNSWEEAARNGFNPLEQFDLGTADVAQATALPQQQRIPTMAEMTQAFARNIGDKRFSMLNPENAMKLFEPYMQANEAARIEQRKSKLVDTLKAAKDADEKLNSLWGGYITGDIPFEALNAGLAQHRWELPYMENWSYNDGQTSHFGSRNPRTGEISDSFQIQNNLSPQQVKDNSYRRDEAKRSDARYYAGLESSERINNANLEERKHEHDSTLEYNREGRDWEHNNPTLITFKGQDGTLYFANPRTREIIEAKTPDGQIVKLERTNSYAPILRQDSKDNFVIIDPNTGTSIPVIAQDGTQQQGQRKNQTYQKDLTDSQKLRYNAIVKEATELRKQLADYQKRMSTFADNHNDPLYIDAKQNVQRIEKRLAELEAEQKSILGDTSIQPQNNSNPVGLTPFPRPDEPAFPQNPSPDITVTSGDNLPAASADVTNNGNSASDDVIPVPRKNGDKITAALPNDIWFNSQRDIDIPDEQVMTLTQFKEWFNSMLADPLLQNLTPEQILQIAVDDGIRILPENNQATLPPEVAGTTFMGEFLPGLLPHEDLAASVAPVNLSSRRRKLRRPRANIPTRRAGQISPNTSYAKLKNEVDSSARKYGIDNELIQAIIQVESRWDSNAVSKAGAIGLMQLMPRTAKWLGVRDPYNPAQNIEGGSKYIAQLIRQYKGNVSKALMAYNCGPGNVNKGRIPASSRNYARNVMTIYNGLKSKRGK